MHKNQCFHALKTVNQREDFTAVRREVCRRSVVQGFERKEETVTWTHTKRLISSHLSFMVPQ